MKTSDLTNQEKLEEIFEMTKENNDILRNLRRQQYIANAFRFLYWVVILVSLGGAYYYVKPAIDSFNQNKTKMDNTLQQFNDLRSSLPETKLFDQVMQGIRNATGVSATTTNQ
ncbi:TPA: hypothetical protein DEP94_01720 [Candidatus Nomurabacteria bacterium]|nr:hypothetical protein [Candidatus Nomurabacteria bacterium]